MKTPSPIATTALDSRRAAASAATLATLIVAHGLAVSAHAAAAPAPAADPAKDEAVKLDALTVSDTRAKLLGSPKFTEPLRDTPQTLVVVPKLVIEQQGATTLSEVLRNTPGITFAAGEGGAVASGDSFFMRGFDTSGSIFIDGVRDTGAYTRDTFNLEQVEIAKGPAGADNGRGGASGYVNLATKTPRLESLRTATVLFGSADQKRATLDLSQPLGDRLARGTAVRVAALWQESGVPGRDSVETSSRGIAPSLALGLGTPTRVTLAGSLQKIAGRADSGLPVVALPSGTLFPAGLTAPDRPVSQNNFYGHDSDFDRTTVSSATARVEHDFSRDLRFTHQSRLARNDRDALISYIQSSSPTVNSFAPTTVPQNPASGAVPAGFTPYTPATAAAAALITPRRIRVQQENEIVAHQANLTALFATGGLAHTLSAGAEFARETQFTPAWSATGGSATSLHAPDSGRAVAAAQFPYRAANRPYVDARTDTAAAYAFDTVRLSPRLLFNGSLRFERYKTRYKSLAAATLAAPAPALVALKADGELLSWKTGFVFKPVPAGSVYAAYGNSLTPAGSGFALSAAANNQNNPNLDPQETNNLEAGVKWEFFQNKLSTSLALYRTENLNGVSTDAATGLVTQDISQLVQGVEFGVSGRFSERWLIFGGFGFIDSEFRAAGTTAAANDGASLRYTPRLSGSLWTTYIFRSGLTVGGGVQYSDGVVRNTSTGAHVATTGPVIFKVPSYWLYSAMADYALSKSVSLRLNLNNLTDEAYFRLNTGGGRYYPGAGRSYQLSLTSRF
jgi:catecholate siderophore receptor